MYTSDHPVNAATVWGVNRRRVNTWDETGMRYNYTPPAHYQKANHSTSRANDFDFVHFFGLIFLSLASIAL
jgi:hypothetical protein